MVVVVKHVQTAPLAIPRVARRRPGFTIRTTEPVTIQPLHDPADRAGLPPIINVQTIALRWHRSCFYFTPLGRGLCFCFLLSVLPPLRLSAGGWPAEGVSLSEHTPFRGRDCAIRNPFIFWATPGYRARRANIICAIAR